MQVAINKQRREVGDYGTGKEIKTARNDKSLTVSNAPIDIDASRGKNHVVNSNMRRKVADKGTPTSSDLTALDHPHIKRYREYQSPWLVHLLSVSLPSRHDTD